jgi:hypothetical protein
MKISMNAIIIFILSLNLIANYQYSQIKPTFTPSQITTYQEGWSRIAELTNGNLVIVYQSTTATTSSANNNMYIDIYANVFDSKGNLLTQNKLIINNPSSNISKVPSVCSDGNAGFVVVWEENDGSNFSKVQIKHFDASFTPASIITANSDTTYTSLVMSSITRLVSGNYVVFFSCNSKVYAQIYDSSFSAIGGNFLVEDASDSSSQQTYSSMAFLQDGGFVLVWYNTQNGNDVIARFYDKNGVSKNSQQITVNTNSAAGDQNNQSVCSIANGNVVIVWRDQNDNNIYGTIFDQSGTPVGSNFFNPNQVPEQINNPKVFPFAGGFGVTWDAIIGSTRCILLQLFDSNANKVGTETVINTDTSGDMLNPHAIEQSKTGNLIFTWTTPSNQGDVTAQFYYKIDGVCSDIVVRLSGQTSVTADFSAITNDFIVLKTLPTQGQLVDTSQNALVTGTFIDKTNVVYVSTNQQTDTFTYALNTSDTACTVTINVCYQTCTTCTQYGDSTNHYCTQCATNYFMLSDVPNNCYLASEVPQNYYFDSNTSTYIKCYDSCATCTDKGDVTNHNCNNCATNYFNLIDNPNNCYLANDPPEGYYFDPNLNIFTKCYTTCSACNGAGDIINHNCTSCVTNYYKKSGDLTNCYSAGELPDYYLDNYTSLFNKCFERCLTCKVGADSNNQNCSTCINNYFALEDKQSQCYLNTEVVSGYFFDTDINMFKRCFSSCGTCKGLGTIGQNLCLTCQTNYYPLENDASMCFPSSTTPTSYYFDSANNVFKQCYKTCGKCNGAGDILNPNCTECASGLSDCSGCTKKVYKDTCVDECPPKTIYNPVFKACTDCGNGEFAFNNKCITTCPNEYPQDLTTCIACQNKIYYAYQKTCVQSCPSDSTLNPDTNICELTCALGYFDSLKEACVTCADIAKIYFQGNCVDNCPDGFSQEESTCQKIPSVNIGIYYLI